MKKTTISTIFATAILVACGNSTTPSNSETDSIITTDSAEVTAKEIEVTSEPTKGLPCSLTQLNEIWDKAFEDSEEGFSRILQYDVDDDGTPEIFLSGEGQYVVLTCKDGKMTQVDTVEPGHMYIHVYDDSKISISHEFPHGQADMTSYYTIENSKATLTGSKHTMYPDALSFDEDEEPAEPVIEYEMLKGKKMVAVSKEEFENTFNPAIAHTTIDDLDWKSIEEFE